MQLDSAQDVVFLLLGIGALITQVVALVDCIRRRADAFVAAGKMTKTRWLVILGIAVAIGFVSFTRNPLGFLNIIAFVAAAVYLVDVKPAVGQMQGRGGGNAGPYGPW